MSIYSLPQTPPYDYVRFKQICHGYEIVSSASLFQERVEFSHIRDMKTGETVYYRFFENTPKAFYKTVIDDVQRDAQKWSKLTKEEIEKVIEEYSKKPNKFRNASLSGRQEPLGGFMSIEFEPFDNWLEVFLGQEPPIRRHFCILRDDCGEQLFKLLDHTFQGEGFKINAEVSLEDDDLIDITYAGRRLTDDILNSIRGLGVTTRFLRHLIACPNNEHAKQMFEKERIRVVRNQLDLDLLVKYVLEPEAEYEEDREALELMENIKNAGEIEFPFIIGEEKVETYGFPALAWKSISTRIKELEAQILDLRILKQH